MLLHRMTVMGATIPLPAHQRCSTQNPHHPGLSGIKCGFPSWPGIWATTDPQSQLSPEAPQPVIRRMEGPHPWAGARGMGTTWNRTCSLLKLHTHIPSPQDPKASFQLLLSSLHASWTLSRSRFGLLVNVSNSGPKTTHILLEEFKNTENFKRILFLICFHVTYYHMKNLEFSTTEGSFLEFFFPSQRLSLNIS